MCIPKILATKREKWNDDCLRSRQGHVTWDSNLEQKHGKRCITTGRS